MATSGSVTTNDNGYGRYYKVSWTATQSATDNSSTISWEIEAIGGSHGYYVERTLSVSIYGDTVYSKTSAVNRYAGTIKTGKKTIKHDSNGERDFKISIEVASYTYAVNCTGSKTFTLTTIPRASTITSASDLTLGNKCSIKWTPKSTSFRYKLKFTLGNWSYTTGAIHPNQTSAFTYDDYTIPKTVANQLPSATSGTMKVYLYTYSNSACTNKIGSTDDATFTVKVPTSIVPTIKNLSLSVVNSNSTIASWSDDDYPVYYVKGFSKVKIDCDASGSYSSTIKSYVVSSGYSATPSTMPYTTGTLSKYGNPLTFKCKAKDSRGRYSDELESTVRVWNYNEPSISSFTVKRDEKKSTNVIVKADYTFSSINGNNKATITLYYKKKSSSSWTNYGTISKNTSVTLNKTFDEASSYDFKVTVSDSLSGSDSSNASISTTTVLLDFRAGGKGLGIGKICESNSLEVAFDGNFKKNVNVDGKVNASNIGRTVYSGVNLITDKGLLSTTTDANHGIYFYLLKPFNLVYFRMYVDGLKSDISASNDYTTLCTVDARFKPPSAISLSATARNGCDAVINTSCEIRIIPRGGLSTSSSIYISGILPLDSDSSLYE